MSINVAKLYSDIFDHAVSESRFTVADAAKNQNTDVQNIYRAVALLRDNAMIEVNASSDDIASHVLLCEDSQRLSKQASEAKYTTVFAELIAKQRAHQSEMTTAKSQMRSRQQSSDSDSATATATARQPRSQTAQSTVYTLRALATDDKRQREVVQTTDARYLSAYAEHKYERAGSHCLICDDQYSHCKSLAICSRCYNRARLACESLFQSRAVVTALRAHMSESALDEFIVKTREVAKITYSRVSSKQAASLLKQSLIDSE